MLASVRGIRSDVDDDGQPQLIRAFHHSAHARHVLLILQIDVRDAEVELEAFEPMAGRAALQFRESVLRERVEAAEGDEPSREMLHLVRGPVVLRSDRSHFRVGVRRGVVRRVEHVRIGEHHRTSNSRLIEERDELSGGLGFLDHGARQHRCLRCDPPPAIGPMLERDEKVAERLRFGARATRQVASDLRTGARAAE